MIMARWQDFRQWFGRGGATDVDGLLEWPVSKLRIGGFANTISFPLPMGGAYFPVELTCNAGAADAVTFAHEYDWYMSARTDDASKRAITLRMPNNLKSGSVRIELENAAANLLPATAAEYTEFVTRTPTADELVRIFRDVTIYVQRRSDLAIQWIRPLDSLVPQYV